MLSEDVKRQVDYACKRAGILEYEILSKSLHGQESGQCARATVGPSPSPWNWHEGRS